MTYDDVKQLIHPAQAGGTNIITSWADYDFYIKTIRDTMKDNKYPLIEKDWFIVKKRDLSEEDIKCMSLNDLVDVLGSMAIKRAKSISTKKNARVAFLKANKWSEGLFVHYELYGRRNNL